MKNKLRLLLDKAWTKWCEIPAAVQLFLINFVILLVANDTLVAYGAVYRGTEIGIWTLWQVFTSMFLHGGLMHLLGNYFFFLPAALYLEHKMGKRQFLKFYIATGLCSSLMWIASGLFGVSGAIGSSGAVYGCIGGALLMLGITNEGGWKKAVAVYGLAFAITTQFLLTCVSVVLPMGTAYFGHMGGCWARLC